MSIEINLIGEGVKPSPVGYRWTPEKRKEYTRREKEISKARSPAWTPEKREAAREKSRANLLKSLDDHQRYLRKTKTRYIKKIDTGEVFVWTQRLAERKDMIEVSEDEFSKDTKKNC